MSIGGVLEAVLASIGGSVSLGHGVRLSMGAEAIAGLSVAWQSNQVVVTIPVSLLAHIGLEVGPLTLAFTAGGGVNIVANPVPDPADPEPGSGPEVESARILMFVAAGRF